MDASILEVRELYKRYPNVEAVNGVSFGVREGRCFGILGPNGAGKTTTVEIMEGIILPTSGQVMYRRKPLNREYHEAVGIQFQATALQDFITVRETLRLFHRLYKRTIALDRLVDLCALREFLDRDNRKLSGGQRQRLLLALALLNDPEVLFLDEPTTGLDPQSRRNFWDLIEQIKRDRKTIVLTTHYMEEAYRLCDEIVIMDHGRLIAQGSPSQLLAHHFEETILQLPAEDFDSVSPSEFPHTVLRSEHCIEISTRDVDAAIKSLVEHGVQLSRLQIRPPTLDDLFLELTGHELRP